MLINRCLSFYCTPTQMLPNRHPLLPNFGPLLDPVSTFIFRRGRIPVWAWRSPSCRRVQHPVIGGGRRVGSHSPNGTRELVDYARERDFTAGQ